MNWTQQQKKQQQLHQVLVDLLVPLSLSISISSFIIIFFYYKKNCTFYIISLTIPIFYLINFLYIINFSLSDKKTLAYIKRTVFQTSLILYDFETGNEKILYDDLDWDQQEAYAPAGKFIFILFLYFIFIYYYLLLLFLFIY